MINLIPLFLRQKSPTTTRRFLEGSWNQMGSEPRGARALVWKVINSFPASPRSRLWVMILVSLVATVGLFGPKWMIYPWSKMCPLRLNLPTVRLRKILPCCSGSEDSRCTYRMFMTSENCGEKILSICLSFLRRRLSAVTNFALLITIRRPFFSTSAAETRNIC